MFAWFKFLRMGRSLTLIERKNGLGGLEERVSTHGVGETDEEPHNRKETTYKSGNP